MIFALIQLFRWFEVESQKWRGVIGSHVWTLHQDENFLYCNVLAGKNSDKLNSSELKIKISHYLRLDNPLSDLYQIWSLRDSKFASISKDFMGVRILNQDPVENIFSFICSSNNNIER